MKTIARTGIAGAILLGMVWLFWGTGAAWGDGEPVVVRAGVVAMDPPEESVTWIVTDPVDPHFIDRAPEAAARVAAAVPEMPAGMEGWKSAHQLEWEAHAGEAAVLAEGAEPSVVKRSVRAPQAGPRTIASGKRVLGWHPYWAATDAHQSYQYSNLTTIAYFSYEVNPTNGGYYTTHNTIADWNTDPVVEWAHANGVKVVLTATLFDPGPNKLLLTNSTACNNLISNLLTVVTNRGGDGVCIDFEAVGSWTGATAALTTFMSNLTAAFHAKDPDYEVSIALPSVDWYADFAVSNYDAFGLDYAIVMGYDYYYSGSSTPGPVAPLYSSAQWIGASSWCSVNYSMNYYLGKGISPGKLMLGVPYYGRRWAAESTSLGAASLGSAYSAALSYGSCESAAATYGKLWDTNGSVPYYVYTANSTNYQCFYDDTNSLGLKYDLSESKDMGGIGIWNLTQGIGETELWNLIGEKFGGEGGGSAGWQIQDPGTTAHLYGVDAKASSFAVVGAGGAISTSADSGVTWTSRTSGTSSLLLNIASGGGLWVGVGDAGTVVTSVGGATWTVRTSPTNSMLRGVCYGDGAYVAGGAGGTLLRSTTGTSDWTVVSSGTTNTLQGVNYLNGLFIATGENSVLLTSSDGSTWTSRTSNAGGWLLDAAHGNGTYVAVGIGARIVTSPDGTTWTRQTNGLPNTTADLYRVAFGNGQFVAVGQSGTIWGSTNGVDWSAEVSGTTNLLRGVVYSNDLFVVAGWNGTILTKGAGAPVVEISTPGATVANGTSSQALSGTANAYVVGTMSWTNSLGGGGTFAAATNWSCTASLAVGTNVLTVAGTNTAGASASDSVTFVREAAEEGGGSGGEMAAASQPVGSLSDIVVYTSAGHGVTGDHGSWIFGRGLTSGVVEDIGNIDQLEYFADYCFKAGATVVPMRPIGHQTNEVVLDNTNSACVTFGGIWYDSASTTYYGAASATPYRYAYVNATGTTAWAIYRPNLPSAGYYPVYTWAYFGDNRVRQLYRVYHSGGVTDVRVNHRRVGCGWVWLGTYHFEAGTNGSVNISNHAPDFTPGTDVVIADAIRFGNGMGDIDRGSGVSGLPRELEASYYWVRKMVGQGMSSSLYDGGYDDLTNNVGCPSRMVAEMNRYDTNDVVSGAFYDRIYLGFHSNADGGAGTARGPQGLLDIRGTALKQDRQKDFARIVAQELTNDLGYGQSGVWYPDDFVNNSADLYSNYYGEIYGSMNNEMNSTIIEVAYHNNSSDANLLKCPSARRVMAMASYQAIVKHLTTNNVAVPAVLLPDPPTHVSVSNSGPGAVTLRWHAPVTNRAGGHAATGYILYRSTNGYGFGNPVSVSGAATLTATLTNMTAGQIYYFQVCATNAGGESMPADTVGVRVSPAGYAPHMIVTGFDRNERRLSPVEYVGKNIGGDVTRVIQRRINSHDYVIQHGTALAAAGRYFDSCENEAVADGDVNLNRYYAAYWILGRESTSNETFSTVEQVAVSNFLAGGNCLFLSCTEIGWDLQYSGTAADKSFCSNVLRTAFVSTGDDAGTGTVTARTTDMLAGLGTFTFDYEGTGSTYKASYPDKLLAAGSPASTVVLAYGSSATGTNVAALAFSNGYRLVVMGFPFETIDSASVRTGLMGRVVSFFGNAPADVPVVEVTTTNQSVASGTASLEVSGTNSAAIVGTMVWTNSLGGSGTFAAAGTWSVEVALSTGTNLLTITGTNVYGEGDSDQVEIIRPSGASGPVTLFEDDFEDGDLAGWTEDGTGNWTNSATSPITGSRSLKHNLSSTAATNYVYAQPVYSLAADQTTWRFTLKNGAWDPSADNRFHVYLAASDSDLKGTVVNGYAVGVNVSGSDDLVKLWRVTSGAGTAVLASALDWGSGTECAIEVTRTAAGEWELKTGTNGTFSGLVSAGTAADTTYTNTTYYGLYYKCTSTRAGQVWLDDVLIQQGEASGAVDSDGDGIPDDYEVVHFGGATNGVAGADDDEDGASNWTEYIAGTDPKTNGSVLAVTAMAADTNTATLVFRWPSVAGRVYSIWRSTNATAYTQHVGGIAANTPTNSYTNAAPAVAGSYFYGLHVSWPDAP